MPWQIPPGADRSHPHGSRSYCRSANRSGSCILAKEHQRPACRRSACGERGLRNQVSASRLSAAFTESAIVLFSTAFIGKASQNYVIRCAFHEAGDLAEFFCLRRLYLKAIEGEIDWLELTSIYVVAKE